MKILSIINLVLIIALTGFVVMKTSTINDNSKAVVEVELKQDTLFNSLVNVAQGVNLLNAQDANFKYWIAPIANDYIKTASFVTTEEFLKDVNDISIYQRFQNKIYPTLEEFNALLKELDEKAKAAQSNGQ